MSARILFLLVPLLVACGDTASGSMDAGDPGDGGPPAPSECPPALPQHVPCTWTTPTHRVCPFGSVGCFCDPQGSEWVCKTPRCSFFFDAGSGAVDAQPADAPVTGAPCDVATNAMCIYSDSPRLICFCDEQHGGPRWACS